MCADYLFYSLLSQGRIDVIVLREMLESLRTEGATLTVRSLRYLQLQHHDLEAFASLHKHSPLKRSVSSIISPRHYAYLLMYLVQIQLCTCLDSAAFFRRLSLP